MVSSRRVEPLPTNLPVLTSMATRASVWLMTMYPPDLSQTLARKGFVELVLDAELFEDGRFLGVELDLVDELRLEAADEFDDLAVFLFVVDPDAGEIVGDVIAEDALDEVQVTME